MEKEFPPESLLTQQKIPDWPDIKINLDLLNAARMYRTLATTCEGDRTSLREFYFGSGR